MTPLRLLSALAGTFALLLVLVAGTWSLLGLFPTEISCVDAMQHGLGFATHVRLLDDCELDSANTLVRTTFNGDVVEVILPVGSSELRYLSAAGSGWRPEMKDLGPAPIFVQMKPGDAERIERTGDDVLRRTLAPATRAHVQQELGVNPILLTPRGSGPQIAVLIGLIGCCLAAFGWSRGSS